MNGLADNSESALLPVAVNGTDGRFASDAVLSNRGVNELVSFIGPNFRPSGQPASSRGKPKEPEAAPASPPALAGEARTGNYASQGAIGLPAGAISLVALGAGTLALPAEDLAKLLRNLFQLPKEMIQLLALLSEQEPALGQALLEALMQEESKIPLEALQDFLQGRVDQAQQKLLKLLQAHPAAMAGSGDVGTLMQGLGELADKIKQGPQGALDATVTLYLPFYPLHPPQAFTLRFEPPQSGGEGSTESSEPQLVVYVETLTLGSFRAVILPDADKPAGNWQAVVAHQPAAVPYLQAIEAGLQEAATAAMPVRLLFTANASGHLGQNTGHHSGQNNKDVLGEPLTPDENAWGAPVKSGKQSVGLHPAGGVSVMAIQVAYLLIRIILELDNRNALLNGGTAQSGLR